MRARGSCCEISWNSFWNKMMFPLFPNFQTWKIFPWEKFNALHFACSKFQTLRFAICLFEVSNFQAFKLNLNIVSWVSFESVVLFDYLKFQTSKRCDVVFVCRHVRLFFLNSVRCLLEIRHVLMFILNWYLDMSLIQSVYMCTGDHSFICLLLQIPFQVGGWEGFLCVRRVWPSLKNQVVSHPEKLFKAYPKPNGGWIPQLATTPLLKKGPMFN